MPAGTVVNSGSLVSPGGQQGIPGSAQTVSSDAGNQAVLGSDGRIYVPNPTPVITSVRQRSWNSIGNPNFEIDARTCGTGAPGTMSYAIDRWQHNKVGTATYSIVAQQDASASPILVPGTNFTISQNFFRYTLQTQEASLAASDYTTLWQGVEGICLRELINDVHSFSILVRTSVAGLKFGIVLQDVSSKYSLNLLATIPNANTWTLLTFPSLPVWTSSVAWALKPGNIGYWLGICISVSSALTSSVNGVWQSGNFMGAAGQSNFAASPVGSTFDIAFCQHEPGNQCTQLIDKPFTQNLNECLRYFCKSYNYATKPGTVLSSSDNLLWSASYTLASSSVMAPGVIFPKEMATVPTITWYSYGSGAANTLGNIAGVDCAVAANPCPWKGTKASGYITLSSNQTAVWISYTADAGF